MFKVFIVFTVLAVGAMGMKWLQENGPEASKEAPAEVVPVVRVVTAKFSDRQLHVNTQGRVEPAIRTQAAAEVMGRVLSVSPKFKPGGQFSKGEVMLEIDRADYVAAMAQAQSSLADAKLSLEREEARSIQARRDWNKLGRGEPSDLVLGIPQITSAKARVKAAEATGEKAARDLDRTKLRAPYDCRVEATYTDLGSYISPGARLADLYSIDAFEVRGPVTLEEYGFLKQGPDGVVGAEVAMEARIGGRMYQWQGEIVRSEGNVDRNTLTMYQVVRVIPNTDNERFDFPPAGLFVRARIKGRVMPEVAELPRAALRHDQTLLVVDGEGRLKIVSVDISRTMPTTVLVKAGIKAGDRVVVSPIETPVDGMQLQVSEGQ